MTGTTSGDSDTSAQRSRAGEAGSHPPGGAPVIPASPYIAGVVLDFSRELGDSAHGGANVTQALRLYQASRCSEQAFVELLYSARHRTRQYQGRQGLDTIDNKMAYFFQVVRRLVNSPPTSAGAEGEER